MFETTPINQLLTPTDPDKNSEFEPQQLSLLWKTLGHYWKFRKPQEFPQQAMARQVLFSSWQSGVNVRGEHGPQSFALNHLSLFQYKMFFQQFLMTLAVIYLARGLRLDWLPWYWAVISDEAVVLCYSVIKHTSHLIIFFPESSSNNEKRQLCSLQPKVASLILLLVIER